MLFSVMCINIKVQSGNRGRLRYDVQEALVQFFVGFRFKVSEMAKMLAVKRSGHCKQKITRLWNFIVYNVLPDVKEHFSRSRYRVFKIPLGYYVQLGIIVTSGV